MTDYKALYEAECKHDRDERAKIAALEARVCDGEYWLKEMTLQRNRIVDKYTEIYAENTRLLSALKDARESFEVYGACSDGCTCGDGWSHDEANAQIAAIDAILANKGAANG
jgi:hypothetical protein